MKVLFLYLIIVNVLAFFMYGIDKHKAKKNARRIPEKTLLIVAAIGGCVGAIVGMHLFRHKTKKVKFYLGVPMILILQVAIAICIVYYL